MWEKLGNTLFSPVPTEGKISRFQKSEVCDVMIISAQQAHVSAGFRPAERAGDTHYVHGGGVRFNLLLM